MKYGQTSEGDEMMKTMIGQQQNVSSPNTGLANGLAEASKPGVAQLSTSGATHHVQDNVVEVEEEERNVSTSLPHDGKNDFDAAKQLPEKETVHENMTQEMKSAATEERTTGDVEANVLAGQLCEDILGGSSALAAEKEEAQSRLRFLPNMVVMVKDSSTVDAISGLHIFCRLWLVTKSPNSNQILNLQTCQTSSLVALAEFRHLHLEKVWLAWLTRVLLRVLFR